MGRTKETAEETNSTGLRGGDTFLKNMRRGAGMGAGVQENKELTSSCLMFDMSSVKGDGRTSGRTVQ